MRWRQLTLEQAVCFFKLLQGLANMMWQQHKVGCMRLVETTRAVGRLHFTATLPRAPFSLQAFLNNAPTVPGLEKSACLTFCEVGFSLVPSPALCLSCVWMSSNYLHGKKVMVAQSREWPFLSLSLTSQFQLCPALFGGVKPWIISVISLLKELLSWCSLGHSKQRNVSLVGSPGEGVADTAHGAVVSSALLIPIRSSSQHWSLATCKP